MSDKDRLVCSHPEYQELRESTTFWSDFTIADRFGIKSIEDTYNRAFKEWKTHYKYLTELCMVLNHKLWYFYEMNNMQFAEVYQKFYDEVYEYGMENLKGDELKFFYNVLD